MDRKLEIGMDAKARRRMTIKQKIIAFFEQTDNAPASYYDLMKHVTLSASLATNVAAMLDAGELVEVVEGDMVRLRKREWDRVMKLTDEEFEEGITLLLRDPEIEGGYPDDYDYTTFPDYLIIATAEGGNEPCIQMYKMKEVREWIIEMKKHLLANEDYDCFYDVWMEEDLSEPEDIRGIPQEGAKK